MDSAAQLVSKRVVEARITDRLADISGQLAARRSAHCVVLDDDGRRFVGIVRLGDVAAHASPGNRLLGDLVSAVCPLSVQAHEPAADVVALFERHDLGEAVVVGADGSYGGLITAESVLSWAVAAAHAARHAAQKAEEQATLNARARAAFLAAITHELRTPLSPVLLIASDRAQEAGLAEGLRRDFETIARGVTQETQLIDDLVDLTNVLSGRVPLHATTVPLHPLLDQLVADLEAPLRAKRITVQRAWHAADDRVQADRHRLQQVFEKVIHNAVKFTPAAGQVVISTAAVDEAGTLQVTIRDTGIGLTSEERERLFSFASPLDGKEAGSGHPRRGMGFSLPFARRLVELHEGRMEVASDGRDQGTTITVILRRVGSKPVA